MEESNLRADLPDLSVQEPPVPLRHEVKIALVCQSNLNRSMEAHHMLKNKGYGCSSFGAGTKVRMPGEAMNRPNVYEFGTPYEEIYKDLLTKNAIRYTKNGMMRMVERDALVKRAPERFQLSNQRFDLVITFEERVYDLVITDLESRLRTSTASSDAALHPTYTELANASYFPMLDPGLVNAGPTPPASAGPPVPSSIPSTLVPVHVVNLETVDSHSEAVTGAVLCLKLVEWVCFHC